MIWFNPLKKFFRGVKIFLWYIYLVVHLILDLESWCS